MDPDKNPRENHAQNTLMDLQENYLNNNNHASHQGNFMQDFHNTDDQFHHVNGSTSSNPAFGVQLTPHNIDPFGNLDFYECKPFVENDVGHAHVMDNFQYEGNDSVMNLPRKHQMDMMVASQSYNMPYNPIETKSLHFVAPDEVSCISSANYYKRVGMDKDNGEFPATKRTFKAKKKTNFVKGQWTEEEDRLLIQLVDQYGMRKWSHIAQALPGRIGKQCRERWHNHLRPDIKKDIWNEEEDKILIQAHAEIGNKWAEIAKRLPGRTENSIKNHWNATKRKQYSKRKCRSKYPRSSLLQEYIKSLNLDQNPPKDYRKKSKDMTNNNDSTSKATSASASSQQLNDRLVPNYDFNEVPDLCFDENLFIQDQGCNIDSLLDDIPCAPPTMLDEKDCGDGKIMQCVNNVGGKELSQSHDDDVNLDEGTKMPREMMEPIDGIQAKKDLDLVEMMSQINENNNI